MEISDLARKLRLKENNKVCILDAPSGYRERLKPLPEGVTLDEQLSSNYDVIQVFVRYQAELDVILPKVREYAQGSRIVWVSYPKTSAKAAGDLNRDIIRGSVPKYGMDTVAQIAVDEVWSALRLKLTE